MSELKLQKGVVDAVRANGGVAFKMANRFLVGVSDLFVQIPGCPSMLLEAKHTKLKRLPTVVSVSVTGPQARFLLEAHKAGAVAGVISFVTHLKSGRNDTYMTVLPALAFADGPPTVIVDFNQYEQLTHGTRQGTMIKCLRDFATSNPYEQFLREEETA